MKTENLKKLQQAVATIESLLPELKAILREEGEMETISSAINKIRSMDLLKFLHENEGSNRLKNAVYSNFYDGYYNYRRFQSCNKANIRKNFPIKDFILHFSRRDVKNNGWKLGPGCISELGDLLERNGIEWD